MHDFGTAYYEYVPEKKDDEGKVTAPATYNRVEVSDSKPWKAGLEPRVALEGNQLVVGWYEPNPTTIEGINNQVIAIQGDIADLETAITDALAEAKKYADDNDDNTVTTIESTVFRHCSKITYLFIPSSVTTMYGSYTLGIGSVTEKAVIRFESTTPPSIETTTMQKETIERIEVPMVAVDTYKTATNWSNFADLIVGYGEPETPEGLTDEEVEALNNMTTELTNELSITYDDEILDMTFELQDKELIVDNNMEEVTFSINESKELEVNY
jgi:hypothetical protein